MTSQHLELLPELLTMIEYLPDTGEFFWTQDRGRSTKAGSLAGGIDASGYNVITFKGKRFKGHQLAQHIVFGLVPAVTDHINGVRNDNRIVNLRASSARLNGQNRREHREGQLLGTTFCKREQRWFAQFWVGAKRIALGRFATQEAAHAAYTEAMKLYAKT